MNSTGLCRTQATLENRRGWVPSLSPDESLHLRDSYQVGSLNRAFSEDDQDWSSLQIVCPDSPVERPMPPGKQGFERSDLSSLAHLPYDAVPTPNVGYSGPGFESFSRTPTYDHPRYVGGAANRLPSYSPAASPLNGFYPPLNGASNGSVGLRTPTKAARSMEPVDGFVYQVQFKRAHKNYILAPSAPRNIIPGDFVKVEADRGEDMGIVLSKLRAEAFEEVIPTAGYRGRGFSSGQGERKFLFRLATAEERIALEQKVRDEEHALNTIREKASERGLPMIILDAEYQFDRHKLTFFFEADRRIDFRELVSELFSQFKTRIWMQQVDTSTLSANDAGTELAVATGFLPQRNDRDYIQQASYFMQNERQTMRRGQGSQHAGLFGSMSASRDEDDLGLGVGSKSARGAPGHGAVQKSASRDPWGFGP